MRNIHACALVLASMVGALVACGGDEPQPVTPPPPPPAVSVSSATTAEPPVTPPPEPPKPTLAELEQAAGKVMHEAINAHDADKSASVLTDDAVYIRPGVPPVNGKDAIKAETAQLFAAFPDLKVYGIRTLVKNEVVVHQYVLTGTNSGDFMGQKATNKAMGVLGMRIDWFTPEGKIKESHVYVDRASIGFQLGLPKAKGRPAVAAPTESTPDLQVAKGSPDEDKNVAVVKAMTATMETKDVKAFLDLVGDDSTYEMNTEAKPMSGKKDAKTFFMAFTKAFPDIKSSLSNAWGIGDFVVDEYVTTGTQKGALVGPSGTLPATGKKVEIHGAEVLLLKDGKMVKGWGYENSMEMMTELGLIKPPGAAPAAAAATKAAPKK
jgi:steroid delta-isomerase-like uncharacterized protein